MRVGLLRLATLQRAETPQIQQVVDPVLGLAGETRADKAVDVRLAADDVQFLLDPVGHGG